MKKNLLVIIKLSLKEVCWQLAIISINFKQVNLEDKKDLDEVESNYKADVQCILFEINPDKLIYPLT